MPLFDLVDNTTIDVVGDLLALPLAAGAQDFVAKRVGLENGIDLDVPTDDYIEQILTLPTRGMFGEAKLGHCDASEIIDPTRFWDWQTSPIPDNAPSIAPVSTDTRYEAPGGTTPTPFPTSMINIVNPTKSA